MQLITPIRAKLAPSTHTHHPLDARAIALPPDIGDILADRDDRAGALVARDPPRRRLLLQPEARPLVAQQRLVARAEAGPGDSDEDLGWGGGGDGDILDGRGGGCAGAVFDCRRGFFGDGGGHGVGLELGVGLVAEIRDGCGVDVCMYESEKG